MKCCFRCPGVELRAVGGFEDHDGPLECPSCKRQYVPAGEDRLAYRWPHPIALALYGVAFDEDPAPRAASQADAFVMGGAALDLRQIAEEITQELEHPTQEVRDTLGSRASEARCRAYLSGFVTRLREVVPEPAARQRSTDHSEE